ncbi:acyl-CoA dehydrogenase [Acrocarpospora pleiomorpha]|uniref:Acyl-CoA dehydrogenase n=1 Tax=Acrocarpospora pleiomorpha TaxID=90975 RepID=A0A5M3XD24_9ACTN|nr:acyl-CoA dehydrogenase family protein [Acrocarpospora pleiomorpha]GES19545.1 acyl-CoA dehydrogenase [Acrocarpospora pleiomorpha]
MYADDDVERQIRAELSRVVDSARSRRSLSEHAERGDDDVTRRHLSELGILEAMLPDEPGRTGGRLRHVLAAVEEAAVGLVAPDLLPSALALWTGLAASWPGITQGEILSGPTTVAWPGVLAGAESVRRAAEDGSVTGRLGYVPGGLSAQHMVLVLPDPSGAVVSLVALDKARREPLQVLDRSRPAAVVELPSATTRELGRLSPADLTRLRSGWLAAIAADCLGGMRAAHDAAVGYARQRTAFGRSIGSFQAVRHRCADMFVDVETTRAVVRGAIAAVDEGGEDAPALSLAAASHAMDAFCRVAESSILVHGALGFTYECDAHFYARRAYSNAAWLGGVNALRAELATV